MAPITRAQKHKKMGPIRAFPSEYTDSGRTYENPIVIEDGEEVVINESRRYGGRRNFASNCQVSNTKNPGTFRPWIILMRSSNAKFRKTLLPSMTCARGCLTVRPPSV